MRLAVTGSRSLSDPVLVARYLAVLVPSGPHTLIHGACNTLTASGDHIHLRPGQAPGADRLAHYFALAHGWAVEPHPADWSAYGNSAGHRRNRTMATAARPDRLLAFPGGAGTHSMILAAQAARVPTTYAGWDGPAPDRTPAP